MESSVNSRQQCDVKECPLEAEMAELRERCRKLEELSYVDALTGHYNFRYLQRALEMEMERTRRTKLPTSLIMLDLDHFKNINTVYGHECGNTALAWVARILREGIRLIDIPCRYGGEEFALILPGTSLIQATGIAERLREAIASNPVNFQGQMVSLSGSFGVAVFRFTDELTISKFLSKADELLYKAKNSGRNCVCTEELPPVFQPDEVTAEEKAGLFARIDEDE